MIYLRVGSGNPVCNWVLAKKETLQPEIGYTAGSISTKAFTPHVYPFLCLRRPLLQKHPVTRKGEKEMFKRNEGVVDRILRVGFGLMLLVIGLFLFALQPGVLAWILMGLGAVGLITGATGVCPTYNLFGFSTLEMEKEFMQRCRSGMAGPNASRWMDASSACCPRPRAVDETSHQQA